MVNKARVIGSWLTLALTVSLTLRQDAGQRTAPKTKPGVGSVHQQRMKLYVQMTEVVKRKVPY